MAFIDITLAPALKRVEATDETETSDESGETDETETTGTGGTTGRDASGPGTVEITDADREASGSTGGRRFLTGRRLLALVTVVGAAMAVRRARNAFRSVAVDDPTIDVDVDAADERPAEQ